MERIIKVNEREVNRQCAKLFSETFEYISEERLYYKHYKNPERLEEPIFYIIENEKICAMNAFDQVTVLTDGIEISAVQSSDSAVAKACRGRGLFFKIQTEAMREYERLGKSVAFGVPNDNSYPIFMKLEWKHVGNLVGYHRLEDAWGCVLSLMGRRKKVDLDRRCYRYQQYSVESGRETMIIRDTDICSINADITVGIKRSMDYYDWKIFGHMDGNYKIIRVTDTEQLIALVIVTRKKGSHFYFGNIVEWYVARDLEKERIQHIRKILRRELKGWCDFSTIRFVNPFTEGEIVQQLGYVKKEKLEYKFIIKCLQEQCSNIENLELWKFRGIDADTMLN